MENKKSPLVLDPDAPPSEDEAREAASLRDALADPAKPSEAADFARALSLAHAPRDISEDEHRAVLERAFVIASSRRRGRVIRVRFAFAAAAVVAIAASVVGVVRFGPGAGPSQPANAQLALTRSTQPLFPEPFERVGGESARIDRIAMARSADLRENRFAKWGIR